MAVILHLPSGFDRFRREGEIIGRIVVEYGELEWDFCLLVSAVSGDQDRSVRAMYGQRGEARRIKEGDKLARDHLPAPHLTDLYQTTVEQMKTCLRIRNQYAHTNWIEQPGPALSFVNIEQICNSPNRIDLSNLSIYEVDLHILEDQQRFFTSVMQNMRYMTWEVLSLTGRTNFQGFHYLYDIDPPLEARPMNRRADANSPRV